MIEEGIDFSFARYDFLSEHQLAERVQIWRWTCVIEVMVEEYSSLREVMKSCRSHYELA